jgi:hypothetical protein
MWFFANLYECERAQRSRSRSKECSPAFDRSRRSSEDISRMLSKSKVPGAIPTAVKAILKVSQKLWPYGLVGETEASLASLQSGTHS